MPTPSTVADDPAARSSANAARPVRAAKSEIRRLLAGDLPPLTKMPRVGILVLNWNNHEASQRCLESLRSITYPNAVVYVVDNGSADGSMDRLEMEFAGPPFVMQRNGKNLGFAAGCNEGIARAIAEGCDYVLLLNNDCIIFDPGFLEHGVALAEASPAVGLVGGKILFWPDTEMIWSTGGQIQFWGSEKHIGWRERDRGQYERILRRTFISGALMLIKREVIEAIGLLPDAYFFGKEEWEYSTRALRAGFLLLYQPKFRVYHEAHNSHAAVDPTYAYNWTLSKILYKRRNMSAIEYRLWRTVYSLYMHVLFDLKYALRRGTYQQNVSRALLRHAGLQALRDSAWVEKITEDLLQKFRDGLTRMPALRRADQRP
jgi:GT2 family glycosyltransferase